MDMGKMIQMRHVPESLHRKLKSRAAVEGLSLSDYLVREIKQLAERPTMAELRDRIAQRATAEVKTSPAKAVRAERERR
jgi:plasmid stability protein